MRYHYYPGCSLEGSAREYDLATRTVLGRLGIELLEISDWTCCGASAAEATGHWIALALPARNLALCETASGSEEILVPCSACYLNLKKVTEQIRADGSLMTRLNEILAVDGLELNGYRRPRHLLDVLAVDIGNAAIEPLVQKKLSGLTVAPYYGCQCLRPYVVFDDPEKPVSMEALIRSTGAEVHPWEMGGKCCGASHMNTKPEVGMELAAAILRSAGDADVITTVCPMCQMNLDAYQSRISSHTGESLHQTIVYLPQLIGLAMGFSEQELGLNLNLAVQRQFRQALEAC